MKTDEKKKKKVLSKFTILCRAAFMAILGRMQPKGRGLYTPETKISNLPDTEFKTLHMGF